MYLLFIPVIVVLMGMTLFTLLKGLNAFRQTIDADIDPEGAHLLQLKQNKMMWARIKYQGAAIVVVMIFLAAAR